MLDFDFDPLVVAALAQTADFRNFSLIAFEGRRPLSAPNLQLLKARPVSFLSESAALVESYIREYGLIALGVTIYLESFGAPLPGESALVGASLLAARGDFSIGGVFLIVWIASVLGDSTGYAIGHFGGRPLLLRFGPRVGLTPERLVYVEDLFRRHGPAIVIIARFVVLLRQFNGLVAGSVAMPFARFLLANLIGAALWAATWSFGPYFLGDLFHKGWG